MKATSWTVFFMFKPYTTIHTTLLTDKDDVKEEMIIDLAKNKIQTETGIIIDDLMKTIGRNENFGSGWVTVEMNDTTATETELRVLGIHKT